MAENGVNIEVLYSDHEGRLILLVDDLVAAQRVRDDQVSQIARHKRLHG
jgi:leucyl aminopeptidase